MGAGEIVRAAHLPAYKELGLPVRWIFDLNPALSRQVAADWGIPRASRLEEILADGDIQIVDIAIPPAAQVDVCRAALQAGKNVLAQKPLAPSLDEAQDLVLLADSARLQLVVNQQMRWSPVVRAIRTAREDGSLGRIQRLVFYLDLPMAFDRDLDWIGDEPRFVALFNTIHLVDTARHLCGEVRAVRAYLGRSVPMLRLRGEDVVIAILEHRGGPTTEIVDRRNASNDLQALFRAEGSRGALRGTFGAWMHYPTGVDDVIESFGEDSWQPVPVRGRWIPDAFVGPMSELAEALNDGPMPSTCGRDHLATLRVVEAIYASGLKGRRVVLAGSPAERSSRQARRTVTSAEQERLERIRKMSVDNGSRLAHGPGDQSAH